MRNAGGLQLKALAAPVVAVAVLFPPLQADPALPLVPAQGTHGEPPTGQAASPSPLARPLLEEHLSYKS